MGEPTSEPLSLYETTVEPGWVDYNGHMSEAYYVLVLGYATDALLDAIGMDDAYRRAQHVSLYTVEAHVSYLQEVGEGEPLTVTTHVLGVDDKRVHLFHFMRRGDGGLVATEELLLYNVDTEAGRSAPLPQEIAGALRELAEAHRDLPVDKRVGRSIALPAHRR
jgi:acyl-CoA thioesterase FadM